MAGVQAYLSIAHLALIVGGALYLLLKRAPPLPRPDVAADLQDTQIVLPAKPDAAKYPAEMEFEAILPKQISSFFLYKNVPSVAAGVLNVKLRAVTGSWDEDEQDKVYWFGWTPNALYCTRDGSGQWDAAPQSKPTAEELEIQRQKEEAKEYMLVHDFLFLRWWLLYRGPNYAAKGSLCRRLEQATGANWGYDYYGYKAKMEHVQLALTRDYVGPVAGVKQVIDDAVKDGHITVRQTGPMTIVTRGTPLPPDDPVLPPGEESGSQLP